MMSSPRPYYPKSWLWPEDYAATLIQKTVRQYFVQRDEEVQEMREFWKVIKSWHTFVAILLTLYYINNTVSNDYSSSSYVDILQNYFVQKSNLRKHLETELIFGFPESSCI